MQETADGRTSPLGRIGWIGLGAVLAGGVALGLSGLASAQEPRLDPGPPPVEPTDGGPLDRARSVDVEIFGGDDGFRFDVRIWPEDPEALAEFEACLADEGFDEETLDDKAADGNLSREDLESVEEAFRACRALLGDGTGALAFGFPTPFGRPGMIPDAPELLGEDGPFPFPFGFGFEGGPEGDQLYFHGCDEDDPRPEDEPQPEDESDARPDA